MTGAEQGLFGFSKIVNLIVRHHRFIQSFTQSELTRQNCPAHGPVSLRKGRPKIPTLGILFLIMVVGRVAYSQNFVPGEVVFPITDFKPDVKHLSPMSLKFGTGFCLDPQCRFVGTNYHVAELMGAHVRIKGAFSVHRYLDSDPTDTGAETVETVAGEMRFTPTHDLAIYEMRRGIKHFHGISFDTESLADQTDVDIYAYPFNGNPKRALVCWHGRFVGKSWRGLLVFSYDKGGIRGGASGGIVVDINTKRIVGILSEANEHKAFAVPIEELADFVARTQPYLQATIFPETTFISPVAEDLYPPYTWPHIEGLSARPEESPGVVELRHMAGHLADSMGDFSATETIAWGKGAREAEATDAYQTMIVDGIQQWRHPDEKKFHNRPPLPQVNGSMTLGSEWSDLPELLSTDFDLKIRQAPDTLLAGRTVHVFQYTAELEDKACRVTYVFYFIWGPTKNASCHGEVLTDESGFILRISLSIDVSGSWHHWRGVMTYGWLEKGGKHYQVPITLAGQVGYEALGLFKETFWCRELFTDYEVFGVKSRLLPISVTETSGRSLPDAQ